LILGEKWGLGVLKSVSTCEKVRKIKEKRKKSCEMALEKVCESVSKCESLEVKMGELGETGSLWVGGGCAYALSALGHILEGMPLTRK
jgi:hypothetical protein